MYHTFNELFLGVSRFCYLNTNRLWKRLEIRVKLICKLKINHTISSISSSCHGRERSRARWQRKCRAKNRFEQKIWQYEEMHNWLSALPNLHVSACLSLPFSLQAKSHWIQLNNRTESRFENCITLHIHTHISALASLVWGLPTASPLPNHFIVT